jgi:hypothetical protein
VGGLQTIAGNAVQQASASTATALPTEIAAAAANATISAGVPERVNDFATPGVINLLCKAGLSPKLATPFLAVG